jgi:tRNA nucleotidyltransferase (CCA-adding enzyme)
MAIRTTVDRAQIPADVMAIYRRLRESGHGAWVVGGCVRDHLMGRPVADWDLCTTARPEQVRRLFSHTIPTGIEHGTITVLIDKRPYEVTTLRGETTYTDGRRPDGVFFVEDITHDLARRDFTINAIAYDPGRDQLIDPFGGIPDLARGIIRAVGDPMERFREDGLRVLRAARFVATLEFDLDDATRRAIEPNLTTFVKVSAERVRDEWLKTMKATRPSRAFEVMRTTGILALVCPPLVEGYGCTQNRHHEFDVWTHTMRALDYTPPGDAILRVAALLHDVGKPRTRRVREDTGEVTFYNHERVGADLADDFLRAYRFSNDERARVTHLIRHHLVAYDDGWTDAAVRRFIQRVGPAALDSLLTLCAADSRAKGAAMGDDLDRLERLRARVAAVLAAGNALTTRDLQIDGNDLQRELGLPPSRRIGEILTALLERVIEAPSLNQRDRLLALARAMAEPSR